MPSAPPTWIAHLLPAALSLGTCLGWGSSNFLGGFVSKRVSPFLFAASTHVVALVFMTMLALATRAPFPTVRTEFWSVTAGLAGGVALAVFYGSLSRGSMGLAAPVAAVLAATIPAIVITVREGSPGARRLIGFVLAAIGVWLMSISSGKTERKTLGMAILAGCGFALYSLSIKQAGAGSPMWIEAHSRFGALCVTAAVVAYERNSIGFSRTVGLWALLVGLVDTAGSLAFVRAAQLGRLDVVVVIASLHPAVTVILAAAVLKERLTQRRTAGICFALVALMLIAA
jgi:drug/metabolite transporter (DMT)-like permease